jgi:ubiquinone/menaquinone biosynthesis C-methylase UbiE
VSTDGEQAEQPLALTPTSFRRDHVAEDPDAELASQIYVLDLQEQLPGVQRLRDWTIAALDPQPGEVAVDVGCGTGAEVRRLAGLVGADGEAVGVEPHPGLRAEAESRAAAAGAVARFVDGDALSLPFADGSVDVVRCERVFQHLPDPEGAVREFARVLAPDGRLVVVDSDWGTSVQSMGDPDVVRRLNDSMWRRMANPFAGRLLRGQLSRAGLEVDPDIAATAVVMPDEVIRQTQMLRQSMTEAVEEGAISADEADTLERDMLTAVDAGEAFFAVTMFAVLGRRA